MRLRVAPVCVCWLWRVQGKGDYRSVIAGKQGWYRINRKNKSEQLLLRQLFRFSYTNIKV